VQHFSQLLQGVSREKYIAVRAPEGLETFFTIVYYFNGVYNIKWNPFWGECETLALSGCRAGGVPVAS